VATRRRTLRVLSLGAGTRCADVLIDHIIAKKHRGPTSEANLALACFHCNTSKGTDIASIDPDTGSLLRLFNPRLDDWTKDFEWSGPLLVGLTGIGRVTVHILSINADDRVYMRERMLDEGIVF
jgi:hypothetical protein